MEVAAKEGLEADLAGAVVGTVDSLQVTSGPTPTASIVAPPSPAPLNKLQRMEEDILERSLEVVQASMHWQDIEPDAEEPPQAWVDELGREGAQKRFRVARAAWQSAKTAPVGLSLAKATALGITKVRAMTKMATPTLNVNFVNFQAPPELQVVDVESE